MMNPFPTCDRYHELVHLLQHLTLEFRQCYDFFLLRRRLIPNIVTFIGGLGPHYP